MPIIDLITISFPNHVYYNLSIILLHNLKKNTDTVNILLTPFQGRHSSKNLIFLECDLKFGSDIDFIENAFKVTGL